MKTTVFDKTGKGREEIATRVHHLAPRQRTLLLLVDGKRDATELMGKVAGLGLDEKALVELLETGFIQVLDAGKTSDRAGAPVTGAADDPPAALASESAVVTQTVIESDPAPTTIAGPAERPVRAPPLTGQEAAAADGILRDGETQFQALYGFFTETIRSAIGLRGYGMQLKVERAAAIADFRALRAPYLEAVLKAKGPELEHSLRNRLDQLLSLGD